jgi:hypothetical protein
MFITSGMKSRQIRRGKMESFLPLMFLTISGTGLILQFALPVILPALLVRSLKKKESLAWLFGLFTGSSILMAFYMATFMGLFALVLSVVSAGISYILFFIIRKDKSEDRPRRPSRLLP